jgi:hypothetical protein
MASNVILNRNWIKETYAASTARDSCQNWVDDHKDKKTKDEIAEGLKGVLDGLTNAQLASSASTSPARPSTCSRWRRTRTRSRSRSKG